MFREDFRKVSLDKAFKMNLGSTLKESPASWGAEFHLLTPLDFVDRPVLGGALHPSILESMILFVGSSNLTTILINKRLNGSRKIQQSSVAFTIIVFTSALNVGIL